MPVVELVVVSYRTPRDLTRFCDSLLAAAPQLCDWHLTVMNVEARDEDRQAAVMIDKQFRDVGHTISAWDLEGNWGYARSCNFAAFNADPWTPDYYAFFNADVTLTPDAIDMCIDAMEAHPDWGVLGPRQIDSHGRLTHAGIFGSDTHPAHRAWMVPNQPKYGDVLDAITVSGSAYFVRAACWHELTDCRLYRKFLNERDITADGAFLPTSHYFEETWCSYHARAHGWKVVYYGPVVVFHEWHQASKVGGWAEQQFPVSRELFRGACDAHGIAHD